LLEVADGPELDAGDRLLVADAELFGDLPVLPVLQEAQLDRHELLPFAAAAKLVDHVPQALDQDVLLPRDRFARSLDLAGPAPVRRGRRVEEAGGLVLLLHDADFGLLLAELVDRLVPGDPHQVLLDVVAAVEALDPADGAEKGVLREVLGEVDVPDLALQEAEDAVVVLLAKAGPL